MEVDAESPPHPLELSSLEAEKQPMTGGGPPKEEEEEEDEEERGGGSAPSPAAPLRDPTPPAPPQIGEKNGLVKIPQDEELGGGLGMIPGGSGGELGGGGSKFTGLGKEELLRAAGTPPWAKARAILLILFWLGWLGMLGAAAAIVARAPRCRPLPPQTWWELGGFYRAPPKAFAKDLKGVSERLEHVAGLQMKGLVLGPLYPQSQGGPQNLSLERLDPALGSLDDFSHLLQAARKKGLQVIVDLTPNPQEEQPWARGGLAQDPHFQDRVKRALSVWLERGVSGIFLDGIEELKPSLLSEWRNLTEQNSPSSTPRVLVGGTRLRDPPALRELLNGSAGGGGPVLGPFLEALGDPPPGPGLAPQLLELLRPKTPLAWSVGSPWRHLSTLSPSLAPQRLLLLWTLPGTPVLSYGDELGLGDPDPEELTPMPWDRLEQIREGDNSTEALFLSLCRRLGALRGRERSLALGDMEAVATPAPAAAFLRSWDQSDRFLVVLNPQDQPIPSLALRDPNLPPQATLRLSTHRPLPQDPQVGLGALELLPYEGLLLSFPYTP